MAAGNILEAVLNQNIESKFKSIDDHLKSIEDSTRITTHTLIDFMANFKEFSNTLTGGLAKGVGELAKEVLSLNEAIGKMGNVGSNSARGAADDITNAAATLNRYYNERLRYENEIMKLQTKGKIKGTMDGTEAIPPEYLDAMRKYEEQIKRVQSEIDKLTAKNKEAGEAAAKMYDAKASSAFLQQMERYHIAIERAQKAMQRLNDEKQKEAAQKIGLIGEQEPKTINEYIQAIKNLKREINNMDISDKDGIAKMRDRIRQYQNELDEVMPKQRQFANDARQLGNTLRTVASAFGLAFSAQALIGYAQKIREVTGEFELQHRAMQAIIGDMNAANRLWNQTIKLAVKSPYSVKELVTYTKQLAAYRIETSKLYETTKMLADISSGLGVDMQRLILAYGQVKAANYLRGQELRQFSEAGVNILQELANYFTELQGRAISTGEVFEMVSKRMVKFEDVAEVMKRLTQEGGIFFNMQEIQADTLKGKYINLQDSLDLMMNKIGEANRGVFVGFVDTAKWLADNWQKVGNTLQWVSGIILAITVATRAMRIEMEANAFVQAGTQISLRGLSGALARYIAAAKGATTATNGFTAALTKVPAWGWILAAVTAIVGVTSTLISKQRQLMEEQEKFNEETKSIRNSIAYVDSYTDAIVDLTKEIKDLNAIENKNEEQEKRLSEAQEEREGLIKKLAEVNPEYAKTIRNLKYDVDALLASEKEELAVLRATLALRSIAGDDGMKDTVKKLNDADDALTNAQTNIDKNRRNIIEYIGTIDEAGVETSQFLQLLRSEGGKTFFNDKQWNDILQSVKRFGDSGEDMLHFAENYKAFSDEIKEIWESSLQGTERSGALPAIQRIIYAVIGYQTEFEYASRNYESNLQGMLDATDDFIEDYKAQDLFTLLSNQYVEAGDDEEAKNNVRRKMAKFWIDTLDNFDFISDKSRKVMEDRILEFMRETFGLESLKPEDIKGGFAPWQEAFNKEIDKLYDQFTENRNKLSEKAKAITPSIELYKITDPSTDLNNAQTKALQDLKDVQEQLKEAAVEGQVVYSEEQIESLKLQESELKIVIALLGALQKTTGSDNKALDLLNKQIDAIKNAAKQYDEYKKMYDDTSAFDKTKDEVEGLFRELNIGHILDQSGAFDENVIKKNLNVWLAQSIAAAGKGGQQVAEKYISGLQLAFEKENYSKTVIEPFKKAMENALDAISMGDELEKLGIGRDFGKIIFGIDTTTTKQMREQVEKWKRDLTASGTFGDEAEKEYQKMIEKIDDMEDKAQKERLKKYIGYMQQAMSERARIQVQGLAELAETERTFQEEIAKAYKTGDTARVQYLQEMQKAAIEGTRKATNEKLQKQTWEDFKGSDLYVEMFNNLETTSTKVIETIRQRIVELQGSLKDLNPSDLKAIVQEINKLDDEMVKRNPFKGFVDAYKEVDALQKNGLTQDVLTERFVNLQNAINTSKEGVEALEVQLANLENLDQASIIDQFGTQEEWEKKLTNTREMIALLKQTEATDSKSLSRVLQMIQAYENLGKAQKALSDYLQNLGSRVSSIFSSIMSNLEAFGGETTETSQAWGDLFSNIMDIIAVIPNYILLMKAAGVAANEALGVVGWIATAVQLLVTLIVGIAKIRDASITDTIDGYKDKVDALSDSYDRLEKAYDKAWDVQNLVSYREQLQKNIDQQIKYYEAMIKAEESRKDPDESQIREWKNTINGLFDEKDDAQSKFLEELGGITDFKSAAQEFVDAWADAFSETGDGMEGLRDHFNEVLQNIVKKQAMQRVASHYLTGLFDMIDTAIGQNGIVTPEEMEALRAKFEEIAPQFNAALQAIFESLGIFGDQAEGELSGLQKGIQGVTEETAEILAAYLNSIRYYVVDNNNKLTQVANILQDNTGMANPMLAELRSIAQRADDIYNFLFQRRESGTDSMRVFVVNA